MPSVGQFPFLRNSIILFDMFCYCVNALSRADPISTGKSETAISTMLCVNDLNRAILISTKKLCILFMSTQFCVNALNRAILISTTICRTRRITRPCYPVLGTACVNALNRAILISTLPLWNRLI